MSVNPPELFPAFAGIDIGSNSSSDDDYGDFVFSSPCSLHAPPTIPSSAPALDAAADEDDWGDFLAIPLGSQSFHLQSSSPSSLPFDPSSDAFPADPSSPKTSLAIGARWEKHMGALPLSIFGEEEPEEPEQIEGPGVLGNGFDSSPSRNHSSLKRAPSGQLKDLIESLYGQDCVGTDGARARSLEEDNSFDDGTWDFKVALSAYTGEQIDEAEGANFGLEMLASITENGDSKIVVNRSDMDHLEIRSDERGPVDVSVGNEGFTNTLLVHNISVSEMPLHELFPSLGNETISIESTNQLKTNFCRSNTNGSINKTSDDQELCHPPDDSEAEEDLNSAIKLFEHSCHVLEIMRASREQQLAYINAWSKLAFASAKELEYGSKIWTESLDGNVRKLLLAEVESSELLTSLEKCDEAWASGGLQEVLRTMSENKNLDDNNVIKSLLGSIKLIDDVDQTNFPDMPFVCGQQVCFSSVDWNGDRYATKLANFWANQISPNPPELPLIKISKLTG